MGGGDGEELRGLVLVVKVDSWLFNRALLNTSAELP